ncbi:Heat shock protein 83 [Gryllus bimaculatus]|nr:Heat shock protein 83 [Gryllus bimaculatus]
MKYSEGTIKYTFTVSLEYKNIDVNILHYVFVRELISNASDALEKLRYVRLQEGAEAEAGAAAGAGAGERLDASALQRPLEVHLATDKQARTLTIQDTGVGMTREELVANLGTIARSGSKAFLEQLKDNEVNSDVSSIIGQFGVGFYSSFMVAEKVEVYTRSSREGSKGYKWTNVIKKYSNFVGSPIFLNGKQPLWLMDPKDVTPQMHDEFYRFVGNTYDRPRFTLHYKTDAPLTIRSLLYFPEGKPGLFEMSRETDVGVALYSRKVLIKSKADNVLPKWLRFVKGVVDSEDIPLNLSRELLQNSALIRKLQNVLTNRILRFLHDKSVKETEEYDKFYKDYGLFLKEGIVSTHEQVHKEEIGKLLRFESSLKPSGEKVSLPQYCSRLKQGQRDIFYLAAPSRQLAESSPYYEALKKKDVEVLFCYEPYDELVLMQLRQFNQFSLTSVEKEMRQDKESDDLSSDSLSQSEVGSLMPWVKQVLAGKVHSVRVTKRLDAHPCVVTVEEMAAARHFIRTQSHQMPEESRYSLLQPQLELNPRHPIIKKLNSLRTSNPKLAELVIKQIFANSMVAAGLMEDPRTLLTSMNELLTIALEKH